MLVFPISGNISKIGIETAMRLWRGLESITITPMVHHIDFFEAIGKYCTNIVSLKITYSFQLFEAKALVRYTPNLKVLSIRNMTITMRGLCHALNNLKHLEVVNLCHSEILDIDNWIQVYSIDDVLSRVNISCKLITTCQISTCNRCNNQSMRYPLRVPCEPLEDIWREDEICSFSH